jgi:hypothetical protein
VKYLFGINPELKKLHRQFTHANPFLILVDGRNLPHIQIELSDVEIAWSELQIEPRVFQSVPCGRTFDWVVVAQAFDERYDFG